MPTPPPASCATACWLLPPKKSGSRRIKHWAGFPAQAIGYCLTEAKIDLGDVTHVAVNRSGRANFFRKLAYVVSRRPSPQLLLKRLRNRTRSRRHCGRACRAAGPALCRHHRLCRAPSRASRLGILPIAVSRRGGGLGRRLWRFCQRRLGQRQRHPIVARWPGPVSPFARHFLPGDDPVSRLPALRRRVQAHGPRRLRQRLMPARSGKAGVAGGRWPLCARP